MPPGSSMITESNGSETRKAAARIDRNRWGLAALCAIVVLASMLRFGGLAEVGIRFDDEGAYVGDARLWHRCALVLTDAQSISAVMHRDKAALQQRMSDLGVDFGARYAKPSQGYTFLGAAAMFVFGDRPVALQALNAVCGVLAVVVLYGIGAMLFSPAIGLCAALFLAISPYHLVYCRSALPEATSGLFVLLGLWLALTGIQRERSARRTFGLAGIAFGIAITCHYRTLYVPVVLIVADAVMLAWRKGGTWSSVCRLAWRRWAWFVGSLALPAVLIELVFRAARLAASASDSFLPVETFFEAWYALIGSLAVAGKFELARVSISPVSNALVYAGYFVHWHGALALALVVLGLVFAVRQRGPSRILVLFTLTTFALFVNQPFTVARALSTVLPVLYLLAAIGLFTAASIFGVHRNWKLACGAALIVLCVIPAGTRSLHVYGDRSSVADASAFVASQRPAIVALPIDTYHRSKYWLHLEGTGIDIVHGPFHNMGTPEAVVAKLRGDGVRWFIIDPQHWHFRDDPPGPRNRVYRWWDSMDRYLNAQARVAAEFPHLADFGWEFLAEGPGLTHLDEMVRRNAGRLRVYDLDSIGSLAKR